MLPFRQIATLRILALFMMTAVTLPLSSIRKNLLMKICKNDFAFVALVMLVCVYSLLCYCFSFFNVIMSLTS